jgi:hypothetical protein
MAILLPSKKKKNPEDAPVRFRLLDGVFAAMLTFLRLRHLNHRAR